MTVDVLSAVLRALSLIAVLQAAGGGLVLSWYRGYLGASDESSRRLVLSAAIIGVLLAGAHYVLEAGRMAGELSGIFDLDLQSLAAHSSSALALGCRCFGLALIALSMRAQCHPRVALSIVGAVLATAAFVLTGHSSIAEPRWIPGLVLLAHVLLVAYWMGVLPPLFLLARRDPRAAGALASEFSRSAVRLVPMIPILGIALACLLMPSTADWLNPYAILLLAKLAGFTLLMGLAALNKLRPGPALLAGDWRAARWLKVTVIAEYLVVCAVLALTATLTTFHSPEG